MLSMRGGAGRLLWWGEGSRSMGALKVYLHDFSWVATEGEEGMFLSGQSSSLGLNCQ